MKNWYKSKTMWIAILQGVAGTLLVLSSEAETTTTLTTAGYIMLSKTLLDVWIRTLTNTTIK